MVQARQLSDEQIHQGDIFRAVDYIEHADIIDGHIDISLIRYPYVVVLSQECDLRQDYSQRSAHSEQPLNGDKLIRSVIVAPLYNFEHFREGSHYSNLGYKMTDEYRSPAKTPARILMQNNNPRYHYLEFDESIPIVKSIIDFKHFFTVDISTLYSLKKANYICSIDVPYRERISQRFANFLSRIGLPD